MNIGDPEGANFTLASSNFLYRGTCTDNSFQSSSCPQRCSDVDKDIGTNVWEAFIDNQSEFCCGGFDPSQGTCNATSLGSNTPFGLPVAAVIWNWTDGSTLPLNTNADAIIHSKPTNISQSQSNDGAVVQLQPSSSPCPNHDAAIGAGVGVPLGILLLIAVATALLEMFKRKRLEKRVAELQSGYPMNEAAPAYAAKHKMDADSYHEKAIDREQSRQLMDGTPVAELPETRNAQSPTSTHENPDPNKMRVG